MMKNKPRGWKTSRRGIKLAKRAAFVPEAGNEVADWKKRRRQIES